MLIKELTYVPANEIWPNATPYVDNGYQPGYVRGYNLEVKTKDGVTDFLSCCYIEEDPLVYFNDEYHQWLYNEHGWTPTGRITFRGYGIEKYDYEERDTFIEGICQL